MADRKYWGMRVHTRGKNGGILVKQVINGDFLIYQIKNEIESVLGRFSQAALADVTGTNTVKKFKNMVQHQTGARIVDITITPTVKRALISIAK